MSARIVVVGTLASNPYAGMAWMHMQIAAGFRRLGHDAYYFETTSNWPYDPVRDYKVSDSEYAVPYLARIAETFGLGDRWAYRRSYADKKWFGMERARAEELLRSADVVFNVAGSTKFAEEGLEVGRLVYFGTDPVYHEITYDQGLEETREVVDEHDEVVTYGENIGTERLPHSAAARAPRTDTAARPARALATTRAVPLLVHDRRQLAAERTRGHVPRARSTTGARTASSFASSTFPDA